MSDKYFVDTNIPMYAHDTSTGAKHQRAKGLVEDLWRQRTGVVSTQVLQELCVNVRRKAGHPLTTKVTREIISDYLSWQVVVNGSESILEALELEERYQISFWDALVVQAAQTSGRAFCIPKTYRMGRSTGPYESLIPSSQKTLPVRVRFDSARAMSSTAKSRVAWHDAIDSTVRALR
jgi:predicted nucleic acid-binding protein